MMSNKIDSDDTQPIPAIPDDIGALDAYMTEVEARAAMGLDLDTFRISTESGVEVEWRDGEPFYKRTDIQERSKGVLASLFHALFGRSGEDE